MRNRHWLVVAIGLIALLLFVRFLDQDPFAVVDGDLAAKTLAATLNEGDESVGEKRAPATAASASLPSANATESDTDASRCWVAVLEQAQGDPEYRRQLRERLSPIVGEWYFTKKEVNAAELDETSKSGMFFLALALGGLLEGRTIEKNEYEALQLLQRVHQADPTNSAPLVFAAAIEKNLGNEEAAQRYLDRLDQTTKFDSYLKDFVFTLYDGVKTAADFLTAVNIWAQVPVPNYSAIRKIIEDSGKTRVAEQLMQDALRADRNPIPDLTWVPIEFATGRSIMKSKNLDTGIQDYKSILGDNPTPLIELVESASKRLHEVCDANVIQPEIDKLHEYLDQARRKGL